MGFLGAIHRYTKKKKRKRNFAFINFSYSEVLSLSSKFRSMEISSRLCESKGQNSMFIVCNTFAQHYGF